MNSLTEFKRMNFFTGFFTTAADWNDGQQYHLEKRKLHNRGLHTPGVLRGVPSESGQLRVTAMSLPSLDILVMPGAAIDEAGNEIYLGTSRTLTIDPADFAGQTVYISIRYDESETDYVENVDAQEYSGFTRITELPRLEIITSVPNNRTVFELARIPLTEGVSAISEPSDPDNPGSNEIDRRNVVWGGSVAVADPLLPSADLDRIILLMGDKRRDFAALAMAFPTPSAVDVRQAALTIEILARNRSLRPEQLDEILTVLAAVELDVGQELGALYPVLINFPEYIQYQDAVAALDAAIRAGESLGVILNRQEDVAEKARILSGVIVQVPESNAGADVTVDATGDETTVILDARNSASPAGRPIVRYHWGRRE
jgi:hypothetical protein